MLVYGKYKANKKFLSKAIVIIIFVFVSRALITIFLGVGFINRKRETNQVALPELRQRQ